MVLTAFRIPISKFVTKLSTMRISCWSKHSVLCARSISRYAELRFDGRRAYVADTVTYPRPFLTTNTCLNCVGVMAKWPSLYHAIADDKVRRPSSEVNTSRRGSGGAFLSYLLTMLQKLTNQLTSSTSVGLRQEFDPMFQVFGLRHSFQPIQWEEVPCDC